MDTMTQLAGWLAARQGLQPSQPTSPAAADNQPRPMGVGQGGQMAKAQPRRGPDARTRLEQAVSRGVAAAFVKRGFEQRNKQMQQAMTQVAPAAVPQPNMQPAAPLGVMPMTNPLTGR